MTHGYERVAEHINGVQVEMADVIRRLAQRMASHDRSKYADREKPLIDSKCKLDSLPYDTPEYRQALAEIDDAVKAHYEANSHHPQHFADGVLGMSLLDLIEMLCDWRAAAQMNGTPVAESVEKSIKRFGIGQELQRVIVNTYLEMDWGITPKANEDT